jgi:hypothetical protein
MRNLVTKWGLAFSLSRMALRATKIYENPHKRFWRVDFFSPRGTLVPLGSEAEASRGLKPALQAHSSGVFDAAADFPVGVYAGPKPGGSLKGRPHEAT